jgi:hypothetical protein
MVPFRLEHTQRAFGPEHQPRKPRCLGPFSVTFGGGIRTSESDKGIDQTR